MLDLPGFSTPENCVDIKSSSPSWLEYKPWMRGRCYHRRITKKRMKAAGAWYGNISYQLFGGHLWRIPSIEPFIFNHGADLYQEVSYGSA